MSVTAMEAGDGQASRTAATVPGLKVAKFGLWMTLAPALIDYRTPDGATWAVPFYSAILLISLTGTGILLHRFGLTAWSRYRMVLAVATGFCLISIGSGLFWGNPPEVVLRTAPPLILYASGMFAVGALMAARLDPRLLWPAVLKAVFIGMLVQVAIVQVMGGINLTTVRYEILIGAAPVVSAFIVAALFFGGWRPWSVVMSVMHLGILLISVTRSHVAVLAVCGIFLLASARERLFRAGRFPALILGAIAVVSVVLLVDFALPTSPLGRWVERFTIGQQLQYGYDVTEITRIGEAKYQIEKLTTSPIGMMFGYGSATPTGLDVESRVVLRALVGAGVADTLGQGIGHNTYVGMFFVGGLIGGGALLLSQIWILVKSFSVTRLLSSARYSRRNQVLLAAPLAYVAMMAVGGLSGTLGARSSALVMALTAGFTLWLYGLLEKEIKLERRQALQRRRHMLFRLR